MEKKTEITDTHLATMVEIVLQTGSKKQMIDYYQSLTFQERAELMAHMKSFTMQSLINTIRNHAENLAK
jgi:hypothetical protein